VAQSSKRAKREKKKTVGKNTSSKGVREPSLHDPAPKIRKQRPRIALSPQRPAFSPMAAPQRRVVTIAKVELVKTEDAPRGWARKPDLKQPHEYCLVVATLSDGRTIERRGKVVYRKHEREQVLEAVSTGEGAENALRKMRGILDRRARTVQALFGELQREYGNGVPA
jgi:hypothetical protein